MTLRQESGGENDSRVNEARQLLDMIDGFEGLLSTWEANFIESIGDQLTEQYTTITAAQLFKLRDIKDKVIR